MEDANSISYLVVIKKLIGIRSIFNKHYTYLNASTGFLVAAFERCCKPLKV